jgi:hypothetical protein
VCGAFDKQYASMALKDHIGAVALFEQEASSGNDPDFRKFAAQTLPTLKHHLAMAQARFLATDYVSGVGLNSLKNGYWRRRSAGDSSWERNMKYGLMGR